MHPLQLLDPASGTCTYLLHDPHTREALIIDPVDAQIERDLAVLQARGLRLCWALETHAHADHITSAGLLAEHAGAALRRPRAAASDTHPGATGKDGDVLHFGAEPCAPCTPLAIRRAA
jgi:sulfur dioxygenase